VARRTRGIDPDGAVQTLTQDVGMAGVPGGVGQAVNHDVEQRHLFLPPRHIAACAKVERLDGRVGVAPHPLIQTHDMGSGLSLVHPMIRTARCVIIPTRQRLGIRATEDLTEVSGVPNRVVLDQAEQVGPCRRQRASNVVLRQSVELPYEGFAHPAQVVMKVCFRMAIHHNASLPSSIASEREETPKTLERRVRCSTRVDVGLLGVGLWQHRRVSISDLERITTFGRRFAQAQASDVVDLPWGFGLLQREFPASYDHNRVVVTSAAPAAHILAAADELLGGARLAHRYVVVDNDGLGRALSPEFTAAGYEHEQILTMIYSGPEPRPPVHEVRAVSLDVLRPALVRDWRIELPGEPDDVHRQLADRAALYSRGADVTLLAVFDGNEIAAHADLYIDPVERFAQIENLVTHQDFRGRGYGRSLVQAALRGGQQAGCEISFLTSTQNDWPREWYDRLGFVEADRTHHFNRNA
jgi:ribosomal protein S18 acetylase RimI-like enzyme